MDDSARQQEIRQLLSMQSEIMAKLNQLGIKPVDTAEKKSPDGGAVSNAHQFIAPKYCKTVRVRFKDGSADEAIIRQERFDDALHEMLDQGRAPRAIKAPSGATKSKGHDVVCSNHTREEMMVMTIPTLRLLPEVRTGMDADAIPDKKSDLVDAIMRIRGKHAVTTV